MNFLSSTKNYIDCRAFGTPTLIHIQTQQEKNLLILKSIFTKNSTWCSMNIARVNPWNYYFTICYSKIIS